MDGTSTTVQVLNIILRATPYSSSSSQSIHHGSITPRHDTQLREMIPEGVFITHRTLRLTDTHLQSLYSIPAAWILSIAPHFYASSLGKFDNKNPRTYVRDTESDQSIDKGEPSRAIHKLVLTISFLLQQPSKLSFEPKVLSKMASRISGSSHPPSSSAMSQNSTIGR